MANFSIEAEIDELFRAKMKEFALWAAENWTMSEREAQDLTMPSASPKEYARGYSEGIASIPDALDCWLEEYGL
jgi:hypothetical protein